MKSASPHIAIGIIAFGDNFALDWQKFSAALQKQTHRDFALLVQDNEGGKWEQTVRADFPDCDYQVSNGNIGWGAAHNQMIARSAGDFYLCANVSQVWDEDFLEKMAGVLERDREAGSVTPLILSLKNDAKIDSAGLQLLPDLRAVGMMEGQDFLKGASGDREVFGGSGCALLLRRAALDQIKISDGQFFDERMWMWKEDVDLALRLQIAGWKCVFASEAVTRYRRHARNQRGAGKVAAATNQLGKSQLIKQNSALNQDLIWAKYFDPNKKIWSAKVRREVGAVRPLRHMWEQVLERDVTKFKQQKLAELRATLADHAIKMTRGQVRRLEELITNPRQEPIPRDDFAPRLSISTIDRVRSREDVARLLDFYEMVLQSEMDFPVEILFVLNSDENSFSKDFEQKFGSLKCPENVRLRFIHQPQIKCWRGITSYVAAHNHAQNKWARGEWRLLLNPDVILGKDTLCKMLDFVAQNDGVGVLGVRMQYDDGRVEPIARRFPKLFTQAINRMPSLQKTFPGEFERYHMLDADAGKPFATDWVCGHCMLVRGSLWQKVGGKDPQYFHYMSDVDLCREIGEAGGGVFYNPQITIGNRQAPSSKGGLGDIFTNKMMQRHLLDAMRYFWKWKWK